ncbi:MAG: type II toxin-antitoxin system VapC family toxin [Bryobacterales bacterium]|nr:type II toxin-antitoxin system VapC family toxin [Bryobacterales bacterium]
MSTYLLDTSIVSVPLWEKPDPALMGRLEAVWTECAIPSPVWHELTYGWCRLPRGRRRSRIQTYLSDVIQASFPILPYDEAAAAWHGRERARLDSIGRPAPFVDAQIAAVAAVHQMVLVTANPRDFKNFEGLRVENWSGSTRSTSSDKTR